MRCKYVLSYYSPFFKAVRWSGYPDKETARRDARALEKEGATKIQISPYKPWGVA